MQFLNYATIPVGALIGGVLGNELGLRSTMWIMVVAFALTPLILLIGLMKRGRDFPTGIDAEEPLAGSSSKSCGTVLARRRRAVHALLWMCTNRTEME
ncbi:hypothetical protein [Nocardioides sp. Iso805N]|uniref:hypothetical protein n=1 Tax=Nocardioides sp. Iso805N TaxID=1283287 RepID=UPI00035EF6FE|nr:hypothetical protein [Nocardioides sp. Iso805N]